MRQDYLFDLGAADLNGDNQLDIFTTNHYSAENIMVGDGQGNFTDVLASWGLAQDTQFPGLNRSNYRPNPASQGLHIYRSEIENLHLEWRGDHPVRGSFTVPSPGVRQRSIQVLNKYRAKLKIQETPWRPGLRTQVQFMLRPNARLVLKTRFAELPYRFKLERLSPAQIKIGADEQQPNTAQFTLRLRDRHGTAWADVQGDGRMDVFMSRGGLKSQIQKFPAGAKIRDEMLINTGSGFRDRVAQMGFEKQGNRSRKVAWVDFNQDNRLDLFIQGEKSPNQLWLNQLSGRFRNVAARYGLDVSDSTSFNWIDLDQDSDADLLLSRRGRVEVYRNQVVGGKRQLQRQQVIGTAGVSPIHLAIADYDQDGDFDAYLVSPQTSFFLTNHSGTYSLTDPTVLGLPRQSLTANWVDYDNDGLLDLHVMPGHLYRQTPERQFVQTAWLSGQLPTTAALAADDKVSNARAVWFDYDNNGSRDLLAAWFFQQASAPLQASVCGCASCCSGSTNHGLYRNSLSQGSQQWLQVNLVGPSGNRQAIGAQVRLITPSSQQLQSVGSAEGSHYSQGHYRLYFGLGQQQATALQITWPDGRQQTVQNPAPNQLLTVQYSG